MNNLTERRAAFIYMLGGATGILCLLPVMPPGLAFSMAAIFLTAVVLLKVLTDIPPHPVQDAAIAVLVVLFVPLSLVFSPLPAVSLSGAAVLIWCIGAMFAAERWLVTGGQERAPAAIAGVSLVFAAIALAFLETIQKFPFAAWFNASLPHFGGFAGIPESGLPANELGGVAALLIPVLSALLLDGKGQTRRNKLFILASTIMVLYILIAAQSRGAYLAAFAGLFVALLLSSTRSRVVLGILLATVVAGIALSGIDTLSGIFSYHRRFDSFFPLLSGRDDIWLRGWMLLTDLPFFGAGFDAFGHIASAIYPFQFTSITAVSPMEDAHNLYLQTALDFGVAGAWVFLVFLFGVVISLIRDYRRSRSSMTAGLLGGIIAYMLFNFTDAVALGSPASAVVFVLFAAARVQSEPPRSRRSMLRPFIVVTLSAVTILAGAAIVRPLGEQHRISAAIADLQSEGTLSENTLDSPGPSTRLLWYAGHMARAGGNQPLLIDRWRDLAAIDPAYIEFMAYAEPLNADLANAVILVAPGSADALFWLARIRERGNPADAVTLYCRGLALQPTNGWAWLGLGKALQAQGDTAAAHRAYVKACFNDDPGLNGCWRAAHTAEALGDTALALKYYDISNFIGAVKRASELRQAMER